MVMLRGFSHSVTTRAIAMTTTTPWTKLSECAEYPNTLVTTNITATTPHGPIPEKRRAVTIMMPAVVIAISTGRYLSRIVYGGAWAHISKKAA